MCPTFLKVALTPHFRRFSFFIKVIKFHEDVCNGMFFIQVPVGVPMCLVDCIKVMGGEVEVEGGGGGGGGWLSGGAGRAATGGETESVGRRSGWTRRAAGGTAVSALGTNK